MKKSQSKTTSILLRATYAEKSRIKKKSSALGISVTEYLLQRSEEHVLVSPIYGRHVMRLLHSLHLQLLQLQRSHISTADIQDLLSNCVIDVQNHMNMLKHQQMGE